MSVALRRAWRLAMRSICASELCAIARLRLLLDMVLAEISDMLHQALKYAKALIVW